ncbi:hypothetical protein AAG906_030822 [Vitis piasezkii]
MTTHGVPSPTSIHFTIDGHHGILEARDIVEALQIPFKPVDPSAFRQWSPVSQRDMHLQSPHRRRHTSTPRPLSRASFRETIPPAPASPTSAPPVPMPEAVSTAPPMTPTIPFVAPTTFKPSITIFASEFPCSYLANIQHLDLRPPPQPNLPASSEPLAPIEDTIPIEDTTIVEVQIPPPQEATTDPQTVDTVTATPEDASSPPEAPTT